MDCLKMHKLNCCYEIEILAAATYLCVIRIQTFCAVCCVSWDFRLFMLFVVCVFRLFMLFVVCVFRLFMLFVVCHDASDSNVLHLLVCTFHSCLTLWQYNAPHWAPLLPVYTVHCCTYALQQQKWTCLAWCINWDCSDHCFRSNS